METPAPPDAITAARAALSSNDMRDRDQKLATLEDAYKTKYGSGETASQLPRQPVEYDQHGEQLEPLTPAPEIAKLAPSAITARIAAIRELRKNHNEGSPEHRSLSLDLEACYRALHPEDKAGDAAKAAAPSEGKATTLAATAPLALPALPSELSERQYDEGVLRELGALVAAAGAESGLVDVLPMFAARGNGYLAAGTRPDPDETNAALEDLWGEEADARIDAARGELEHWLKQLTPAARAKVKAYLDETGLSDDVALIRFFEERAAARAARGK
ncbi:MAG TPA: hypothetical protein VE932_04965 [Patescibacteria group bacterium]|nr:hypothetical protein [Patescibacteria group bacterium]